GSACLESGRSGPRGRGSPGGGGRVARRHDEEGTKGLRPEARPLGLPAGGERRVWQVRPGEGGLRLGPVLARREPQRSRAFWQKRIEAGDVRVNGQVAPKKALLNRGDQVEAVIPPPEPDWIRPEPIPLNIVYEDPHLIVVDKPAGMVVHPGAGQKEGSLGAALLAHCGALSSVGGRIRPGIVHRLDKETSGLLVAAKNDRAHLSLPASSGPARCSGSTGPSPMVSWSRRRGSSPCPSAGIPPSGCAWPSGPTAGRPSPTSRCWSTCPARPGAPSSSPAWRQIRRGSCRE